MKILYCLSAYFLLILIITSCVDVEGEECNQMGEIPGTNPPEGQCNPDEAKCCVEGEKYPTYDCSSPVSSPTTATLTLNNFDEGGDGGGASECDGIYHPYNEQVVALSTGWFNNELRCNKNIIINGNGRTVTAKVVDQCDSTKGCDKDHGYQPPCANNVVDASGSVWDALGLPDGDPNRGELTITWSDA